jgi:hypothetical protein
MGALHALEQPPQKRGSVSSSAQIPLQFTVPRGHVGGRCEQTADAHVGIKSVSAVQVCPHPPQFCGDDVRFAQPPMPQSVSGGAQLSTQPAVAEHFFPTAQATSHLPQWSEALRFCSQPFITS